ncbi:MAG: hypothetical protein AMXMBFR84_40850 [Candidatus Hydrogenedentota bacterium]
MHVAWPTLSHIGGTGHEGIVVSWRDADRHMRDGRELVLQEGDGISGYAGVFEQIAGNDQHVGGP